MYGGGKVQYFNILELKAEHIIYTIQTMLNSNQPNIELLSYWLTFLQVNAIHFQRSIARLTILRISVPNTTIKCDETLMSKKKISCRVIKSETLFTNNIKRLLFL